MSYEYLSHDNFLGLDEDHSIYERADIVILPVPYEVTVSYGQGTRRGPQAIITASQQVELYDRELGYEPALRWGAHTTRPIAPSYRSPGAAMEGIATAVAEHISSGKLLCVLGGEHSISGAVAAGLARLHDTFVTVQLDAHADLRNEYEGTPHSHACAARRILDAQAGPVMQLGVRSLCSEEASFIREQPDKVTTFFAEDVHAGHHLEPLRNFVRGRLVYLTLDVDCFDATIMPATGTPEPGGLTWEQVLEVIRAIAQEAAAVLAFDIVELAPQPSNHAPDYLVAKLTYKIMALFMAAKKGEQ